MPASAQSRRKALLIGNAKYAKLPPVPSAEADLTLIRSALESIRFQVTTATNLPFAQMGQTVRAFSASIRPGDEVFLYFSGIGMHSQQQGDNFLLAADFDPARRDNAFSLTAIMQDIDEKNPANKMVFIDAARSGKALGEAAGLILPLEQVSETLMVFSHQFEQVFADATAAAGQPGPFAQAIAAALRKPGLSLFAISGEVIVTTANLSKGQLQPVTAMQKLTKNSVYLEPEAVKPIVIEKPVVVLQKAELEAGATRELKKAGLLFSWIPPGEFQMGCVPADRECAANESPRHVAKITQGFWITKTEVTAKSFNEFSRATGAPMPKPTTTNKDWLLRANPVTRVSWESAQGYCQWIGGRLPTEAEWEYAARGGVADRIFPWGDTPDPDQANMFGKAKDKSKRDQWDEYTSAPVGSFEGNPWGLMDVSGNVREWVFDWYDPAYYKPDAMTDPKGPQSSPVKERVVRGGDFYSKIKMLRLSSREFRPPDESDNRTGFRCVLQSWPAN